MVEEAMASIPVSPPREPDQQWFLSLDEARVVRKAQGGTTSACVRTVRAVGSWASPAAGPAGLTARLVSRRG